MLRTLLRSLGVHVWTDRGEIVHADGSFLAINRLSPGIVHIHLPLGVSARPLDGTPVALSTDGMDVAFKQYETRFFSLHSAIPAIDSVVNEANFKSEALSPGAWISILGQNFGQPGRPW